MLCDCDKWDKVECVLADGCLRFYLRGRPISLYAPTALMPSYQPTAASTPPRQKLALEWVYPFMMNNSWKWSEKNNKSSTYLFCICVELAITDNFFYEISYVLCLWLFNLFSLFPHFISLLLYFLFLFHVLSHSLRLTVGRPASKWAHHKVFSQCKLVSETEMVPLMTCTVRQWDDRYLCWVELNYHILLATRWDIFSWMAWHVENPKQKVIHVNDRVCCP